MELHDPYMFMGWGGWWWVGGVGGGGCVGWLDYLFNQIQILKKLSLWFKKNQLPTQMDLYDPHMVFYRIS